MEGERFCIGSGPEWSLVTFDMATLYQAWFVVLENPLTIQIDVLCCYFCQHSSVALVDGVTAAPGSTARLDMTSTSVYQV